MRSVSRNVVVAPGEVPASGRSRPGDGRRRGRGGIRGRSGGLRPFDRHSVEAMLRTLEDDDGRHLGDGSQADLLDDGFDEAGLAPPENVDGLRAYLRAASLADATLAEDDEVW